MGTNKCASQAGMTAYGTRRHLYDPKTQTEKPYDQTTISLQMGTNKGASQVHPKTDFVCQVLSSHVKLKNDMFFLCLSLFRLVCLPQAPGGTSMTRR